MLRSVSIFQFLTTLIFLTNSYIVTKGALPHVHHFDSKAKVEAYIRTIALPATFMLPGFYMSNFPGSALRFDPSINAYTFSMPVPSSSPVPLFATNADAGKFVKAILSHREETLGKRVLAATKYYTFEELIQGFKNVFPAAGTNTVFKYQEKEEYMRKLTNSGIPEFAAIELYENMTLLAREGYYGGDSLDWSHSVGFIC